MTTQQSIRQDKSSLPKQLRFAMVTTFYPPYHFGGDGQLVRQLTHALAGRGHQVTVIHDADAFHLLSGGRKPNELEEPKGVQVHRLRSRNAALSCLATQQLGRPVVHGKRIRRILEQGFDVIHFHNISLVGGPAVLAFGHGIKLYTTHEHWLVCPSHILWRHNRELCTGRQCLRCVLRHGRPPQLWRGTDLLRRKSRHVDAFLAPSQFCAGKHKEFGFDREMEVIANFLPDVPQQDTVDALSAADRDRSYFLFVGRLETIKGLQDVIPHFLERGDTDLLIAGQGNHEPALRELAAGSPRVQFLGQQTPEQLRSLYGKALAVIAPSICYEVFPMILLEAFREGTPVIARNLGPYPEIVRQSQAGLLFTSAEDLSRCLTKIESDIPIRESLKAAARRAFLKYWSEDVVLEQYFDLIRRLAQHRPEPDSATRPA